MDRQNKTESDGRPDHRDTHLVGATFHNIPAQSVSQSDSVGFRAISSNDEVYDFTEYPGRYVVFNHKEFNVPVEGQLLGVRHGTEQDVSAIQTTFNNLGFTGNVHHNLDVDTLEEHLIAIFQSDFTDYASLFVFILTHGSTDGTLYASDGDYTIDSLVKLLVKKFMHPTLVGKPKVFVIQACRGDEKDVGICTGAGDSDDTNAKYLPIFSDLLMVYASPPGYESYRNTAKGSWFIQSLCETIQQRSGRQDLESMLTVARRTVAYDKQTQKIKYSDKIHKQIPIAVTTLTKTFYLTTNAFTLHQH